MNLRLVAEEYFMSSYWGKEDVFLDGDQYFDSLLADIKAAQKLITIEIYIFNDDVIGKKITEYLIAAHTRGVEVQIIVDGVGSYSFFDRLHGEFEAAGIIVKMFHPLPFLHPYYGNLNFKQRVHAFFTRLWRMNQRNHRKIVTLDSNTMYVSSYNFSIEHTKDYPFKQWKDMGVRVEGEHVQVAILNFKKIWNLKEYFKLRQQIKPLLKKSKHSPLRMSSTIFRKRLLYRDLIQRINRAENRIWLVTPYFIPKGSLILALGRAAKRGVDVKILISQKTDVRLFQTLQFFYYPYLLAKGVKVFQYNKTVLHAKNFIIDNFITVGSSNLNHRSLLHDLEVDLSIQKQINKEMISKDFIHSTEPGLEITLEHLKKRTLFDTFLSRLFFVFKYWF